MPYARLCCSSLSSIMAILWKLIIRIRTTDWLDSVLNIEFEFDYASISNFSISIILMSGLLSVMLKASYSHSRTGLELDKYPILSHHHHRIVQIRKKASIPPASPVWLCVFLCLVYVGIIRHHYAFCALLILSSSHTGRKALLVMCIKSVMLVGC